MKPENENKNIGRDQKFGTHHSDHLHFTLTISNELDSFTNSNGSQKNTKINRHNFQAYLLYSLAVKKSNYRLQ